MSKGLEALDNLVKDICFNKNIIHKHPSLTELKNTEEYKTVEKELKRLEKIDDKKVVYMTRTHSQAQKVIDELSKHKEVVITNLSDQKKLKVLEIIVNKKVDMNWLFNVEELKDYNNVYFNELTQEEYDLLKEVLL